MLKHELAAKHDEELTKLEDDILADEVPDEESESEEPSDEEETSDAESAPETKETPEEEEPEEESVATDESDDDFTEEEMEQLSDKTRRQMSKLRKKLRETEARFEKVTGAKGELESKREVYQPLEDVAKSLKETPLGEGLTSIEDGHRLPWDEGQREISPEDYQKHVADAAGKLVDERISRERSLSLMASDAKYLESNYDLLNPDSDSFDKELTQKVYRDFKRMFLADPNPSNRLKDFAEPYVKRFNEAKAKESERKKQTLKKQQASQAVVSTGPTRPTPSVTEKIQGAKTIEELESLEKQL